jgi:hypothetical protein
VTPKVKFAFIKNAKNGLGLDKGRGDQTHRGKLKIWDEIGNQLTGLKPACHRRLDYFSASSPILPFASENPF